MFKILLCILLLFSAWAWFFLISGMFAALKGDSDDRHK